MPRLEPKSVSRVAPCRDLLKEVLPTELLRRGVIELNLWHFGYTWPSIRAKIDITGKWVDTNSSLSSWDMAKPYLWKVHSCLTRIALKELDNKQASRNRKICQIQFLPSPGLLMYLWLVLINWQRLFENHSISNNENFFAVGSGLCMYLTNLYL